MLTCILLHAPVKARAVEIDKVKHFTVAFGLTKGAYWIYHDGLTLPPLQAKIFSAFAVTFISITKEYMDREIDMGDLAADGLGILSASFLNLKFEF